VGGKAGEKKRGEGAGLSGMIEKKKMVRFEGEVKGEGGDKVQGRGWEVEGNKRVKRWGGRR